MSIVFNSKDHVKERQGSKPLSLEEMNDVVESINFYIDNGCFTPLMREDIQRMVFEYENLKHQKVICQCCYKNTTTDIDVNYEIVNNKL
jgi:hypothetical protein